MKILYIFSAVLASVATVTSALANEFSVYGTGGLSCGTWVEARRTNNDVQQHLYRQWVTGWIVGYNYYSQSTKSHPVSIPEFDTVSLWLDTYCQNNPTHYVFSATASLVEELGGHKAQHKWSK